MLIIDDYFNYNQKIFFVKKKGLFLLVFCVFFFCSSRWGECREKISPCIHFVHLVEMTCLYINPTIPINREDQLPLIKGDNLLWQKFLPWGRLNVPNLWGTRWGFLPPTTPIYPSPVVLRGGDPASPEGRISLSPCLHFVRLVEIISFVRNERAS